MPSALNLAAHSAIAAGETWAGFMVSICGHVLRSFFNATKLAVIEEGRSSVFAFERSSEMATRSATGPEPAETAARLPRWRSIFPVSSLSRSLATLKTSVSNDNHFCLPTIFHRP